MRNPLSRDTAHKKRNFAYIKKIGQNLGILPDSPKLPS